MVELGLVLLIQQGLGNPPLATGGYAVQLPKDFISATQRSAWTYRSISAEPSYHLGGQSGYTSWEVQIDCHGYEMADAIKLARAIDNVLRGGYRGTFSDADRTFVHGIFRQGPSVDGFSDANRSFVRSLEYLVNYDQI